MDLRAPRGTYPLYSTLDELANDHYFVWDVSNAPGYGVGGEGDDRITIFKKTVKHNMTCNNYSRKSVVSCAPRPSRRIRTMSGHENNNRGGIRRRYTCVILLPADGDGDATRARCIHDTAYYAAREIVVGRFACGPGGRVRGEGEDGAKGAGRLSVEVHGKTKTAAIRDRPRRETTSRL